MKATTLIKLLIIAASDSVWDEVTNTIPKPPNEKKAPQQGKKKELRNKSQAQFRRGGRG